MAVGSLGHPWHTLSVSASMWVRDILGKWLHMRWIIKKCICMRSGYSGERSALRFRGKIDWEVVTQWCTASNCTSKSLGSWFALRQRWWKSMFCQRHTRHDASFVIVSGKGREIRVIVEFYIVAYKVCWCLLSDHMREFGMTHVIRELIFNQD